MANHHQLSKLGCGSTTEVFTPPVISSALVKTDRLEQINSLGSQATDEVVKPLESDLLLWVRHGRSPMGARGPSSTAACTTIGLVVGLAVRA